MLYARIVSLFARVKVNSEVRQISSRLRNIQRNSYIPTAKGKWSRGSSYKMSSKCPYPKPHVHLYNHYVGAHRVLRHPYRIGLSPITCTFFTLFGSTSVPALCYTQLVCTWCTMLPRLISLSRGNQNNLTLDSFIARSV